MCSYLSAPRSGGCMQMMTEVWAMINRKEQGLKAQIAEVAA